MAEEAGLVDDGQIPGVQTERGVGKTPAGGEVASLTRTGDGEREGEQGHHGEQGTPEVKGDQSPCMEDYNASAPGVFGFLGAEVCGVDMHASLSTSITIPYI
ncbi:hypothetical protein KIPB_005848 [Kipferlia bialata]|uniref:Uncharacterized protein n=1 Tax=Kipferlia bialata TaxID=797122 RepID=A0A391P2T9_9EUKA|nr:hypothetical protein KIPB_005848 [Kipferlia bialata]|eukprot:g5848.t1